MTVRRYQPIEYDEMPGPMVLAKEYDALAQELTAARNRIQDDQHGVNSVMRKNAVLLRALTLATQGDLQGYIDEAERILDME